MVRAGSVPHRADKGMVPNGVLKESCSCRSCSKCGSGEIAIIIEAAGGWLAETARREHCMYLELQTAGSDSHKY